MTRVMLGIATAALLAACSGNDPADYNRIDVPEREARAQAAIDAAAAQNGTASTARLGVPVATPTPTSGRARALPVDFQGFWGVTDDDCELANTAATGRIDVNGDTIRFHESKARVQALRLEPPAGLTAELRFSGEGQASFATETWRLENGGTMLLRSRTAGGAQPAIATRYRRC